MGRQRKVATKTAENVAKCCHYRKRSQETEAQLAVALAQFFGFPRGVGTQEGLPSERFSGCQRVVFRCQRGANGQTGILSRSPRRQRSGRAQPNSADGQVTELSGCSPQSPTPLTPRAGYSNRNRTNRQRPPAASKTACVHWCTNAWTPPKECKMVQKIGNFGSHFKRATTRRKSF